MSTMKKILSLTLALAMLMSVSVFAGFADASEIDKDAKAAVELLAATNIINGIANEDGTLDFAPTATIKRAEAAKMIYVLHNKGVDDKAEIWQSAVTFADCKGHWAAGYIAYCEAKNLINGRTETSFDPEAPVTGTELAKMLLTVAGYKADVEGYTGANWEKNVAADAEAAGIFTGVKFAITQPAPRQWAAVMFKNAFEAGCPAYIGDYRVEGIGTAQTVAEKFLGLDSFEAVVLATETAKVQADFATSSTSADNVVLKPTGEEAVTVDFAISDELVGQQVTVAVKLDSDGEIAKVYGIVATGKTISGELKVAKKLTSGTDKNKYPVTVGGVALGNKTDASIKLNGTDDVKFSDVYTNVTDAKRSSITYTAFDFDGNKTIDYTVETKTTYGVVTVWGSGDNKGQIRIKNADDNFLLIDKDGKVDGKKVTVTGTMKDDIVAKWTVDGLTGKITAAPADVVIGTYTGVTGTKYTVGGAQYEYGADQIEGSNKWLADYTNNLDEIAVLYTDGKYVIKAEAFVEREEAPTALSSNLAYVVDTETYTVETEINEFGKEVQLTTPKTYIKVKVLLADGTVAIFDYEQNAYSSSKTYGYTSDDFTPDQITASGDAWFVGKVFEYEINSKGKLLLKKYLTNVEGVEYYKTNGTIWAEDATVTAGATGYETTYNATKKLFGTGAVLGTDNTLVFAAYTTSSGTTYKVVKLADIKDSDATYKILAKTDDTIAEALLVVAAFGTADDETNSALVVTTGAPELKVEGDKKYVYFTATDLKTGVAGTYKADDDLYTTVKKGGVFALTFTNGVVTAAVDELKADPAVWAVEDKIIAKASGLLVFEDLGLIETTGDDKGFTSSAKVIVKNGSTYTLGAIADLAVAAKEDGAFLVNVMYKLSSGKISYIIIDADGELEFSSGYIK